MGRLLPGDSQSSMTIDDDDDDGDDDGDDDDDGHGDGDVDGDDDDDDELTDGTSSTWRLSKFDDDNLIFIWIGHG